MTQEELINKIKEAQKEFFNQNPCKLCVGNGCDDCRDCDDAPLRHELSSKLFKLKEEFKKLYNIEYDDYINNQKSQSQNSLNKELLLKDISARLPYGVIGQCEIDASYDTSFDTIHKTHKFDALVCGIKEDLLFVTPLIEDKDEQEFANEEVADGIDILDFKPYLFPLSSMTEEQYNDFFAYFHNVEMNEIKISGDYLKAAYLGENAKRDWLNKNHFDYNYHIEKGIVLDANGLNIY